VIYALAMKWQVHTLLFIFGLPLESGVHALIEMLNKNSKLLSLTHIPIFDTFVQIQVTKVQF